MLKPVLRAAMSALAALGLAGCGDTAPTPVDPTTPTEPPPVQCGQDDVTLTSSTGSVECITVPNVEFTFTPDDGDPRKTIDVTFDSEVVFINDSTSADITATNIFDMIDLIPDSGIGDLVKQDGSIAEEQLSVSVTGGRTTITIRPPGGKLYDPGNYTIRVVHYAKRGDAGKITSSSLTSRSQYLRSARAESSFSAYQIETPCTGNSEGWFQLNDSYDPDDCIELPKVGFSRTPDDGDPRATLHVRFDSEVVFVDDSGWSEITKANLMEMLDIRDWSGDLDLARTGGPIGEGQLSISTNEGVTAVAIEPPNGRLYAPGDYEINVAGYARRSVADNVASSSNIGYYLDLARKGSSFRIADTDIPCTMGEDGYLSLSYSDGTTECIRFPEVRYTFTPAGGIEASRSNWDPTATIRIKFDSDVVFIDDSGWSEITEQKLLEVLEFTDVDGNDLARAGGPIDEDELSVDTSSGRTVIAITPPDGRIHSSGPGEHTTSLLGNYAKRSDVNNIINSNDLSRYLSRNTGGSVRNYMSSSETYGSCFVKNSQSTSPYADRRGDAQKASQSDVYMPFGVDIPHAGLDGEGFDFDAGPRRADPNKTYVIDVAFIVSENSGHTVSEWKRYLNADVIPAVSAIYQNSGVNVEFRVAGVSPFSDYRGHLLCPMDTLDGLSRYDVSSILSELVARVQKDHGADLVYGFSGITTDDLPCGAGIAALRSRSSSGLDPLIAARWAAKGAIRTKCTEAPQVPRTGNFYGFIKTLAHEIGHNLGLNHDEQTIRDAGGTFPRSLGFHPSGYGYIGVAASGHSYGTVMSYAKQWEMLPYLSSNRVETKSELCEGYGRNSHGYGFCAFWLHGDSIYSSYPDENIRIGTSRANAAEALLYTIEDASNYSSPEILISQYYSQDSSSRRPAIGGVREQRQPPLTPMTRRDGGGKKR